jgi:hypothetical protein
MSNAEPEIPDIDPSEDPLWARIEAYAFDALDPGVPFAARLARENMWTVEYARRVIEEYRRFCYLAVRAPHPVVPSDAVDQAWHLHLDYSREYWDGWCGGTLECDLHHEPTRDGEEGADRSRDWYRATLDTYERMSQEAPPADIWPGVDSRFGRIGAMRRVDSADYMIVRRPPKGIFWAAQVLFAVIALYLLWRQEYWPAVTVGAMAGVLAIYRDRTDNIWKTKPWRDGDDDGFLPGGCNSRRRDRRDM